MFKIRSSVVDCSICPLYDNYGCIAETNCEEDLNEVDVIFIAENPGKDEIDKGLPLIGRAGKLFRIPFDMYILQKKIKYLLTNVVLCQTLKPDGTTGNPTPDVITLCKENCFDIIEKCNPKLIVLMGASSCSAFGISGGITKNRGNFYKWNNYDVLVTIHPSYVMRRSDDLSIKDSFFKDIQIASNFILNSDHSNDINIDENENIEDVSNVGIIQYSNVPKKYLSDSYKLIDIQTIRNNEKILFMFRDKDNNKEFHIENAKYYCYTSKKRNPRHIESYSDLYPVTINYKNKHSLSPTKTYEGDIRIDNKYAIDYYLQSKQEPDIKLNIFYIDIEVYTGDSLEFPRPEEAKSPINSISYRYQGKTITYVLDHPDIKNKDINNNDNIIFCKTEKEVISNTINDLRKYDPDILTAWNLGFDILYIYNRCPKVGLDNKKLSKFGEIEIDLTRRYIFIAGIVCVDMCDLYRIFTSSKKESYSLDFIANDELGHTKVHYDGTLADLYRKDLNTFIEYNRTDVNLLDELEQKRHYISLLNELRSLCSTTFRSSFSTMGQIDSYLLAYLKKNKLSARNLCPIPDSGKFTGAFVKEPIVGLHNWVVDFDFKSLYPSVIITYNIGVNTFIMKFKDITNGFDFIYDFDKLSDNVEIIIDPLCDNKKVVMKKQEVLNMFKRDNLVVTINGCFFKSHNNEISFYSTILKDLLHQRSIYKNKMFECKKSGNKNKELEYNMKQWSYKILANAFYGVLGNSHFRFYSTDLASSITLSGQEVTKTCILEANRLMKEKGTEIVQKIKEYISS